MDDIKKESLSINDELANSEFPYDKCILCPMRSAKHCDGPNPYALKGVRRIDFLRKLQKSNKETYRNGSSWSYDYIAAQTDGVSKATVVRIMTEENYDPGSFAFGEVFRVLFDSSLGVYPCGIHSEEKEIVYVDSEETLKELERVQQENINLVLTLEQLRSNIGRTHDFQEKALAAARADLQQYIDFLVDINNLLREQINRKDDYIDRVAKRAGI